MIVKTDSKLTTNSYCCFSFLGLDPASSKTECTNSSSRSSSNSTSFEVALSTTRLFMSNCKANVLPNRFMISWLAGFGFDSVQLKRYRRTRNYVWVHIYEIIHGVYKCLYNNMFSFCIFIGRKLCVIKVHMHG